MRDYVLRRMLCICFAAGSAGSIRAAEIYVSPTGNDQNNGSAGAPFATLEKAAEAARLLPKTGDITVRLHDGTYFMDESLELGAADSGFAKGRLIFTSVPGEHPVLSGGKKIADFKPVTDSAILARLDPGAKDHVVQIDLKAAGITEFGQIGPRGWTHGAKASTLELFDDDKPMQISRYPKTGFLGPGQGQDHFKSWAKSDDIWAYCVAKLMWSDEYLKAPGKLDSGQRCYLNILEELSAPGDYYLDRDSGILYFWPPRPQTNAVVSTLDKPLIEIERASFISIIGITLQDGRAEAVKITGGSNDLIAGCTIRNFGTKGVTIRDCRDCGVQSCEIYDVGAGGIALDGGDRATLMPGNNFADNNDIHDFNRWERYYRPGVDLSGVGQKVTHNFIHDGPHQGILFGGNNHLVEFNDFQNLVKDAEDSGCIYTGRDWTARGTIIRNNSFKDIGRMKETHTIYLDDEACGTTIDSNIFFGGDQAIFVGGGRENIVNNNLFLGSRPAILIDNRGMGWASKNRSTLMERLKSVPYTRPPWSTQYPPLARILQDNPGQAKGNQFTHNIVARGSWLQGFGGVEKDNKFAQNFTDGKDPGFADPEKGNYAIKPDSPAAKIGFQNIPTNKIGMYKDDYRAPLPEK